MVKIELEELLKQLAKKQPTLAEITQQSINEGIYETLHSETKGFAEYIDTEKINNRIKEVIGKKGNLYEKDIAEIRKDIVEGIKGGKYLTEKGQKVILQEAIKPKGLFERVKYTFARGEKDYVAKAARVSSQLYDLIKIGGYNMPEIEERAQELKNLGFYRAAIGILHEEGIIRGHDLKAYKKAINEKAKKGLNELTEAVQYGAFENAAKIITAIAGTLLLAFSSANLTGFVIGGNKMDSSYTMAIGFILLIISLLFSLRKHKAKK